MGVANPGEEFLSGEERIELMGEGSFVGFEFARGGVVEAQAPSVEHESAGVERLPFEIAVDRVAQKRATEVFHVDADLMSAPGVQMAEDEPPGRIFLLSEHVVVRDGRATGAGIEDGLLLSIDRVTADVSEDGPRGLDGSSLGGGEVKLGGLAVGELLQEGLEGAIVLGGHDATAGVLVETVNDAWAFDAADAREFSAAVVEEGVDESAIGIAGGRVHDHADRFVDDEEVVVFVDDVEGQILRDEFGRFGLRQIHADPVTHGDHRLGPGGLSVEEDVAGLEEGLDAGAREFGELAGEEKIEAFSGVLPDRDQHGVELKGRVVRGKRGYC